MKTETNELIQVIEESGLEKQTAINIKEQFLPFFDRAEAWRKRAEELVVTDVSQTREMKMAREARLALREIRIDADKTRKALKEDSLRYGKAVQGVYNVIEYLIIPIEKHLEEQEKFAEIQEAKKQAELKEKREAEIEQFQEFIPYGLDFGKMSDIEYAKIIRGAKLQMKEKIEEEKRLEQERLEREKKEQLLRDRGVKARPLGEYFGWDSLNAETTEKEFKSLIAQAEARKQKHIEEQEKIRKENEALRKKQEEERKKAEEERKKLEEKARKERQEAEARFKKEREEREKIEAELKAKREAEEKARKEKEASEKQSKLAPDKEKLESLAKLIDAIELPEMKSEETKKIIEDVKTLLYKTSNFIRQKTLSL